MDNRNDGFPMAVRRGDDAVDCDGDDDDDDGGDGDDGDDNAKPWLLFFKFISSNFNENPLCLAAAAVDDCAISMFNVSKR